MGCIFVQPFFGFLRAAEFTSLPNNFSPQVHLSLGNVSVDKHPVPDAVFIGLSKSKTDQFHKGCPVVPARSNCAICTVAALMSYLQGGAMTQAPSLVFVNNEIMQIIPEAALAFFVANFNSLRSDD